MSEAKFTRGPWTLEPRNCDLGCCDDLQDVMASYTDDTEPNRPLAKVYGGNAVWLRQGESEANAKLIAAAPLLYEACQALMTADHHDHFAARMSDSELAAIEMMRAALAAADGK